MTPAIYNLFFSKVLMKTSTNLERRYNMRMQILAMLAMLFLIASPALAMAAINLNQDPTDEEKQTFDTILQPVLKIYNLIKYVSSAIAALILLIAGVSYMASGSDPKKRDNAKGMAMYVVIGLIVIWAAPYIAGLILG